MGLCGVIRAGVTAGVGLDVSQHDFRLYVRRFARRVAAQWLDAVEIAGQPCSVAEALEHHANGIGTASEELERLEDCMQAGDQVAQRWHDLIARLRLDEYEVAVLAYLVGLADEPLFARTLRASWGDPGRESLPVGLIVESLCGTSARQTTWTVTELQRSILVRCGLLTQPDDRYFHGEVGIGVSHLALHWLSGAQFTEPCHLGIPAVPPPERLRCALAPRLREVMARSPLRVAIAGPRGSGRMAVAGQLARVLAPEAGLLQLRLDRFARMAKMGLNDDIERTKTLAILTGALVVVTGGDDIVEARWTLQERVVDALSDLPIGLIWIVETSDFGELEILEVPPENLIRLGTPSKKERFEVWHGEFGERLDAAALTRLAGGFLLSEGQIVAAAREAVAQATRKGSAEKFEDVATLAARRHATTGLGNLARPETGLAGLEQLVLEPETRTMLDELVAYARHRDVLAAQWGFAATFSYGLGVTALFTGPPGTGKTLAATAIARELEQELYRVDLSQLVSKYIGETEKHLGAVFDAAEQGGIVLLFDEADSLFGRRTEVKTSVDRYANLEVNYLLQRIESFDGVVILTTNFEASIDDAFARRIRFRVAFDAPDVESRRRLWLALLPSQVPVEANVDFRRLAEQFELSGGHIKEVVLRAASLAMQAQETLSQAHLERSAAAEYRKLGKLAPTKTSTTSHPMSNR